LRVIDFAHVNHPLFNVLLHLPSNVYVCVSDVSVARLVKLILQKTLQAVDVVHVLFEEVEKSTDQILGISCVIVATHAVVNVAVSCGSGTRDDHVAVDHVAPLVQFVVTGVVNVIQLLPPQSHVYPAAADIFQDAAPAPVMSWKSTLSTDIAAAVIVLAVHFVFDCTRKRFITELPVIVRVPDTVIFDAKLTLSVFTAWPDKSKVRLKNVNAPVIVVHQINQEYVTVFPLGSKVPAVRVVLQAELLALKVKLSANWNVHQDPLNTNGESIVTQFVVIVLVQLVARNDIIALFQPKVLVIPAVPDRLIDQYIFNAAEDHAQVTAHTSGHAIVKSKQFAVAVIVTVYAVALDALLNITLSAEVGTLAHHAPQEVALQLVVVLASQFHVQPTQYLSAIVYKVKHNWCIST